MLDDVKNAEPLAKALCEGGLPCAEITFRTEAAEECIRIIAEIFPKMLVGAGTVLTTEQVDRAVAAGAKFIVSPGTNPEVVKYCVEKDIPVTPGTANPSDIEVALSCGLDVVKFFPAEPLGGVKLIKAMATPYGNPLYHWSHLELQRYFGYEGHLNGETAEEVWNICNEKLQQDDMTARQIILKSNVKLICTTDDPIDSLEWHQKIKEDGFEAKVLPTWRPDKAMNIEKVDYLDYLSKLSEISGVEIDSFASMLEALRKRMDFFNEVGCRISDHGLEYVMYAPGTEVEIDTIFAKRLAGETITREEELKFKTAFMVALGREYAKKNWTMQLHYGVQRDLNKKVFRALGPDVGIDAINNYASSIEMGQYLNALAETDELPKNILYSLNPVDDASIGIILGCFQDSSVVGKIQQGSAWWFNDNKQGMINQMVSLANLELLGNFIGMLTDSRSFLSYTRYEYFRRIMCKLIGGWVEKENIQMMKEY